MIKKANSNSLLKNKSQRKIKQKQKAISPLIAVILLVVVAVILTTLILSFGKDFTLKGTETTKKIFKEDATLTGFLYTSNPQPDGFIFKNLSNKALEITHYEIIGPGDSEVLNTPLPFSSTINSNAGSQVPIPILCSPGKDYVIKLISSDNSFVTVKINNVTNYEEKSCEDPSIPDLVCLGAKDNGSGDTNSNPYVICSLDDFNNIRNNLSKHYKLGRNLDLNVSPYNEGEGWVPIGNSSTKFIGSLNGSRYTISNLYINRPTTDYQGLFGYTNTGATISDLKLENVNITGRQYVGGLVGYNDYGTISGSSLSGFVSGNWSVGGLVGFNNYGTISGSSSSGSVSSMSSYVGGLVGYNYYGTITSSSSNGSVSGTSTVGGLVGYNSSGTIIGSYSTGSVSGTNNVGGLVGRSSGIITNSYALGDVTRLSGIFTTFGGFLGYRSSGTITNCYSTGRVIYAVATNPTDRGFSSSDLGVNGINNFWDINISLQSTSGTGATGKTTTEMKTQSTFTGWDFDTIWEIEDGESYPYLKNNLQSISPRPTHSVTSNYIGGIYKYLSLDIILSSGADEIYYTINGIDPNCSGTGTLYTNPITITTGTTIIKATGCKTGYNNKVSTFTYILPEPIMIFNADDLNNIRNNLNGFYALGADIDLGVSPYNEGDGWLPIGSFTGGLDGNGHTVSNLYINRGGRGGLFSSLNTGSVINNMKLEDVNMYNTSMGQAGALIGYNDGGIINNVSSSGLIFGYSSIGGLVGSSKSGTVTKSFSTCSVYGQQHVGGFVGYIEGGIFLNNYSLGDVIRISGNSWDLGSFAGNIWTMYNPGNIINSYSTGRVIFLNSTNPTSRGFSVYSTIGNNYFDKDTSLQTTGGSGSFGKTTAEMKTQSTFTGWDFTDIWAIDEGESYPYLRNNQQTPIPKPTHSVASNYIGGIYKYFSLDIILSSGADYIYYTTNGIDPNCSGTGTLYTNPITITTGTTIIKATGCKTGYDNKINTFTYTLPEPIIIFTADDLNNVRNNLNGIYILGANIDLNISPYNTGQGWEPIGNSSTKFTGVFIGNNYNISNLYINRSTTDYQGLFGYTNYGASINNVKLDNVNLIGRQYVGGLVGYHYNGTITSSSSSGSVSGTSNVGGLVGYNYSNSIITECFSSGSVSGTSYVGGLVGYNYSNSIITECFSSGSVSGIGDYYTGGLVGYNLGTISLSYSKSDVSGTTNCVGGLVGENYYNGTITNSYSLGNVTRTSGTSTVHAGFLGTNYGTVTNCYSKGRVIYIGSTDPTDKGFSLRSTASSNYWDKNTSLQSTNIGGGALGKTTAQMKTQSTFTGWDFTNIWAIDAGSTYPYLRSLTYDANNPKPQ